MSCITCKLDDSRLRCSVLGDAGWDTPLKGEQRTGPARAIRSTGRASLRGGALSRGPCLHVIGTPRLTAVGSAGVTRSRTLLQGRRRPPTGFPGAEQGRPKTNAGLRWPALSGDGWP